MSMLEAKGITKAFGNLVALKGVSLTVEPGELRAIIGPNGAGKTTFFNLITGFFPPSAGQIAVEAATSRAAPRSSASGSAWGARSRPPRSSRS
ncbi:MAG: ATP-binding cassette domain-containing protein [Acetobacteraceae bacterium]